MKVRIFKHYLPVHLLVLAGLEACALVLSIWAGILIRYKIAAGVDPDSTSVAYEILLFTIVILLTMIATGLYHKDSYYDVRTVLIRLPVGFLLGFALLATVFYVFPQIKIWRSAIAIGLVFGLIDVLAVRLLFIYTAGLVSFRRRVLVLGAGRWAARLEELENTHRAAAFRCVGFVPMASGQTAVAEERVVTGVNSLCDFALAEGVEEIVVAVEERRGGLPVDDLLHCKIQGLRVTDYSTFWERETGRVDLEVLNPSWLIFSDGFATGGPQRAAKRTFDVAASLILLTFSMPVLIVAAIAVKLDSSGTVLYRQERVGLNGEPFLLLKFRSMRNDAEKDGMPRWAAEEDPRITRVGQFIRMTRIDELPQIFNVLAGDMSFIGPRPERPFFVDELSAKIPYYSARHGVKPGISGWAQLNYPYGASIDDAREKLQYDLYYIKNYSLFLDFSVMLQTARVILWPQGVR